MDLILLGKAVILGVVEGLTEVLPISSTGHLILVGDLLNFNDERGKAFEVIIQFGAILAVCWEFREKLWNVASTLTVSSASRRFVLNLLIASIPAMGLAFIFGKHIKAVLFAPIPVASAFIVGALVIFWAEYRQKKMDLAKSHIHSVDDLTPLDALKVGIAQCAALIPGTSRSGATIIGGMLLGIPRRVATEFSFYLALVVLSGAAIYSLIKDRHSLHLEDASYWGLGLLSAFISAYFCIRWLLKFVATHRFTGFAWYRIVFGAFILLSNWQGWIDWSQKVG